MRQDSLAWREVDGETLLLDLRTSTYLSTNASASVLWQKLADWTTREELVATLVATYDIPESQAAADVDAFLATCRQRELIEETGSG